MKRELIAREIHVMNHVDRLKKDKNDWKQAKRPTQPLQYSPTPPFRMAATEEAEAIGLQF